MMHLVQSSSNLSGGVFFSLIFFINSALCSSNGSTVFLDYSSIFDSVCLIFTFFPASF